MVYRLDRPHTSVIGHFSRSKRLSRTAYVDLLEQPPLRLGGAPTHDPWLSIVYGGTRDAGHAVDLMDSP